MNDSHHNAPRSDPHPERDTIRLRVLAGGLIAGVLAFAFTFGILGGWLGLRLALLPVVEPHPFDYMLPALRAALINGVIGLLIGGIIAWPQRMRDLLIALLIVSLIAAAPLVAVLAPFSPAWGTMSPVYAVLRYAVLVLLVLLTPLVRGVTRLVGWGFRQDSAIGKRALTGAVLAAVFVGLGVTTWAGQPTTPGGYDASCLQSVWAVHAHAQQQGWHDYTLAMVQCQSGSVESGGQATIAVTYADGQDDTTCTTTNWATGIVCGAQGDSP